MEFHEKLQKLRKNTGLTQEELAEKLYVSRTAISKWESGRGYPSIDSLKDIAQYFSVSIDDLLSCDKIITIAEEEKKTTIRHICDLMYGFIDSLSVMLIFLPLYPNTIENFVYSVNLIQHTHISLLNRSIHWILYILLVLIGILKVIMTYMKCYKYQKIMTYTSILLNVILVLFLALTRETYAIIIAFILLILKSFLFIKSIKQSV